MRLDLERVERPPIGALFRLAEAVLALDLDVVEAVGEVEALDLRPLGRPVPVGDQPQPNATALQLVEGLVGAVEQVHLLVAKRGEAVSEAHGDLIVHRQPILGRQAAESAGDDLAAGLEQVLAMKTMAFGVGPELGGEGADRGGGPCRGERRDGVGELVVTASQATSGRP